MVRSGQDSICDLRCRVLHSENSKAASVGILLDMVTGVLFFQEWPLFRLTVAWSVPSRFGPKTRSGFNAGIDEQTRGRTLTLKVGAKCPKIIP